MIVSVCCHREVVASTKLHFPLGGSTWREVFKVDVCSCCGREAEEFLSTCEECGEISCMEHI